MFREWLLTNSLEDYLLPVDECHLYPRRCDRKEWEQVPAEQREICIQKAEEYIGYSWPSLPAAAFMEFQRSGNREIYEKLHFARRHALQWLVLGECLEGKGRFADDIINGIWCICEESFWGVSAHNGNVKDRKMMLPDVEAPYIDLFAAETAALLAWTRYLLGDLMDSVAKQVTRRIDVELERRIKLPFLTHTDFWWMGYGKRRVNNWNPWILANMVSVFLVNEKDENRRISAFERILDSLESFLDIYQDDGGCDEGTSYWNVAGGALFDCLEQLYLASGGKMNFFGDELVKQIGRFLYRAHIADDYFINFADGSARVQISSCMVYRYGKYIGDDKMMGMAAGIPSANYRMEQGALRRTLPILFHQKEMAACKLPVPYERDVWLSGIQVMAARENESKEGFYLAVKGGHNEESHNHNDVGSCVVYLDGKPVLIDAGVGVYTRQTFSAERYTIWTMQSQYHNLPTINGQMQQPGREFCAHAVEYQADDNAAEFSLDLAGAYSKEAEIASYRRTYRLERVQDAARISIRDCWNFSGNQSVLTLNLLCAQKPEVLEKGKVCLSNGEKNLLLDYDGTKFEPEIEEISISDPKLSAVWNDRVWRIQLHCRCAGTAGETELLLRRK
ncbi:MAG: heparinase II/III domain-containing protein [Candidatus Merdivicinus sp.]